jgi:uncharacterized protein (DUF2236 family)
MILALRPSSEGASHDLSVLSLCCHARGDRLKEEALMSTGISSRRRYTSDEISSVYQEISGTTDIATLFWIGSAVEFAFHKDVDWLFFSQGLLHDPLLRVIISAEYHKKIAFGSAEQQGRVAGQIRRLHAAVEQQRGYAIPPEAYRDVLLMIIEMGERAYELIHGPISQQQRLDYFEMCRRLGQDMGIEEVPQNYEDYLQLRRASLEHHYHASEYADQLFQAYRAHFGPVRYALLTRLMALLCPPALQSLHSFHAGWLVPFLLRCYVLLRSKLTIRLLEVLLIPKRYRSRAHAINIWVKEPSRRPG